MVIKKYIVSNMNEALSMIRNELGKEAVIITQRKVRKKGFLGMISPKLIEVTAAIENSKKLKNTKVKEDKNIEDSINSIKKIMNENLKEKKIVDENKNEEIKNIEVEKIMNEISGIKEILNKTLLKEEVENYLLKTIEEFDIHKDIYEECKNKEEKILSKEDAINYLKEKMDKEIIEDLKDMSGTVVLVGPTGVGKTTTIAKLAGKLALKEEKKVGLITVDTYRIGAVDQLKTYAEIMDIPFRVVLNGKEMEEAVKEMENLDVILIDSTGRSSKNLMQIRELNNLVGKANPDSVHLVVSATTKNSDLKNIIEGYKCFEYEKIILTKLDETNTYGSIYNVQKLSEKPIRFLTTGQNVPNDIIDTSKEKMIKLIFNEENL